MKGVYVLLIEIKKPSTIKVGSLGNVSFNKGIYAYIGSAQNSLEKRIKRHIAKQKKLHWHIDYLTTKPFVDVFKVYFAQLDKSFEEKLSLHLSNFFPYVDNFGSTDSSAKSHLFFISKDDFPKFINELKKFSLEEYVISK